MAIQELRILFVEDSEEDVELEERELRKGGLVFRSLRVETRDDLRKALAEFKPDVIISDHTLPRLDGLSALNISREICPEVPFIFVSGTLGEERAVGSLKDGATDYLVKGRLAGLARAVERALKEARSHADRRKLEEQFRQAQKMEAIGRLAGGVAHDFNNLLTVINGYSQLMLNRFAPGDPNRADAEQVLKAGERAAALTRQLLAFSRKQILAPAVLNLNRIVSEVAKMLRRLIGEDVEFVTELDPELGNVRTDPGQMEQVLMNLAVNARDAMPNGGKLTLKTSNVTIDEEFVKLHPGATAGPHVMLAVSDSGHGMDEATQAHLFEPFFTTKEPGKGTGLGLSTVYGIVKQSGGSIWVYSEPGKGATFKIFLPRVPDQASHRKPTSKRVRAVGGGETVLIVEDSEGVRKLMEHVLKAKGYIVLAAGNGEEALREVRAHPGAIHLVLADVVLPHMAGPEVVGRIRALRPEIKVVYSSGYTEKGIVEQGILEADIVFLPKPFTAEELYLKVREALEERPPRR